LIGKILINIVSVVGRVVCFGSVVACSVVGEVVTVNVAAVVIV